MLSHSTPRTTRPEWLETDESDTSTTDHEVGEYEAHRVSAQLLLVLVLLLLLLLA